MQHAGGYDPALNQVFFMRKLRKISGLADSISVSAFQVFVNIGFSGIFQYQLFRYLCVATMPQIPAWYTVLL